MLLDCLEALRKLPEKFAHFIYAPVDDEACWEWITERDYPQVRFEGRPRRAYSLIYKLCIGPVPEGLELDHVCKNKRCVNPFHLEPVTHRINILRGNAPPALMARKTHCSKGHLLEGNNLRPNRLDKRGHRGCVICHREANRNPNSKRIWITNGSYSRTILRNSLIPEGWWHGRTFSAEYWAAYLKRG